MVIYPADTVIHPLNNRNQTPQGYEKIIYM